MCKADSVELGQVVLFPKKWLITAIKIYFKYMRHAEIKRTLSASTPTQFNLHERKKRQNKGMKSLRKKQN